MKNELYKMYECKIIDNIYNDPRSIAFENKEKRENKDGVSN